MTYRRSVGTLLACAIALGACSGREGNPEAEPGVDTRRDEVELDALLTDAGMRLVADPTTDDAKLLDDSEPVLWMWQVDNMEREYAAGGGYLGAELDALTQLADAPGIAPLSFVIAAWLSDRPTPAASSAAELIGQQNWAAAPTIVFPTVVLALFVDDIVSLATDEGWTTGSGPDGFAGHGFRGAPAVAPHAATEGICSTLSGWVNGVLDALFGALTVDLDADSSFGWLGDIWNTAVGLASSFVVGLIEVLTAPLVTVIAESVAIVGTLTMIASLLQPWSLTISPSLSPASFGIEGGPEVEAGFEARADTNVPDVWPTVLTDCASSVGFELPDLSSASGAAIAWTTTGFPGLGEEIVRDTILGEDNTAELRFVTARELSAKGEAVSEFVTTSATVTSTTPDALQALIAELLTGVVAVEPFASVVAAVFEAITEPVFEALAALVQVHGASAMEVVRHEIDENRLYDGTWTGLVFSFATNATPTPGIEGAMDTSEARIIVPLEVQVDDGALAGSTADYVQHATSIGVGVTMAGADGSGYGLMVGSSNGISVVGDHEQFRLAGPVTEEWETFVKSDFPTEPNNFAHESSYTSAIDVSAVGCAMSGTVTTGSRDGGRYVAGYWLAHEGGSQADDLVNAGVRLSDVILRATELPGRSGDRDGLVEAITALDRAVEQYRSEIPDQCPIDPMLQWAGALRGRADDA